METKKREMAKAGKRMKHVISDEQVLEKKKQNDEQRDLFAKKFGILKKASVLLFYERANDAFDEIAKAANIIK